MITFRGEVLPSDVQAVRELVQASGMFRDNEVAVAVELVEEALKRGAAASGYHFVFAEDEERLVGYVCYGPITVTLHSYDLYWIVVDPTCQGQGVGRRLLEGAERQITSLGGRQVIIETSGQSIYQSTQRFYQRCGYEKVASIPDFYAPGDDKWIYVRRLIP